MTLMIANNEHLPTFTQTILGDETVIKHITASGQQVDSVGDNTDLVPGVYEGGWKTWECSYLLLDYLYEKYPKWRKGDNVLELGCGSGLPGLYCLLRGASVTFQDYNKDVLQELTMPNARLTCSENVDQLTNCKFFSGDWKHFHAIMVANKCRYDIILTSETIYNCNSYQKLHNIFKDCLSDHGTILVSCKSHYFGVGGGVESFKDFVARQGVFNTKTVLTTNKNLQCSILQLSRRMTEHLES
ncbi:histidine protein methyltransferase 1 homolog isoform X2 [Watersipora subatra]|uniref:histidine protein methyltransferase 1 homolog isoform X2 n=1 Tax=Watersipora subatra TaxID=2589382 RepID=UPI00355B2898